MPPHRNTERAPRIADVAIKAGVSTASVSRALADPASVRPELLERVREAVRVLGYTPNAAARSLREGRTRTILVVTRRRWSAPFFSEVLHGIEGVLGEAGYSMILANFDTGTPREAAVVDMMFSGHIDGAIVLSGMVASSGGRSMLDAGLPVVSIGASVEAVPSIVVDEAAAMLRLCGHLVSLGHREIAYVTGPAANANEGVRRRTVESFFRERSDCRLEVIAGDFTLEAGQAAAGAFMALDPRPTAVLCCSDEIAIGFMGATQDAGLDVPGDVSVTGFDGIEFADHCRPKLTTIRQPRRELGHAGAARLLAMLRGEAADSITLPDDLRVAASTGPRPLSPSS